MKDHREKTNRALQSSTVFPSEVSGLTLVRNGSIKLVEFHPYQDELLEIPSIRGELITWNNKQVGDTFVQI